MRKTAICLLSLLAAFSASAQSAIDLQSRAALRAAKLSPTAGAAKMRAAKTGASQDASGRMFGFVEVKSEADVAAFERAGGEVLRRRGNILLTAMPADSVERIGLTPGITRVQLARPMSVKLDKARAVSGIDLIHSGIDLPRAYTGRGVITGLVDGGMDPNHINFKSRTGFPRIKHFTYIRPNQAQNDMLVSTYTPAQLPAFKTDDDESYHGTHTMGIMAGGYRGDVTTVTSQFQEEVCPNPFYGVATESDIAASCGQLNDMFIAYGIEYMAEFAYKVHRPMVVNLSLGSNLGAHDGKGVMSRYLNAISEQDKVLFCISAGNEGDKKIALNGTFSPERTEIKTFLNSTYYGPEYRYARQGSVQIYSADSTAFDIQAVIYNRSRGRVAFRMPISGNTQGVPHYWASSAAYASQGDETISPELAKAFEGYVGLGSMIDPDNGRFYAIVDFLTLNDSTYNANNQYLLGISVKGKDGQRIDFYGDGIYSELSSMGVDGWDDGSADGSISDLACTESALVVGSYNNRDSWFSLDGFEYGFEGLFNPGKITGFSSYGTLPDGRSLPHLCAPGATVVSSTNSHFVFNPNVGITPSYLQAQTNDSIQGYWEQMAGTSMSSPLVAGAVALWLEADPTLTPAQIKEIAVTTCTRDADVEGAEIPVKWGAGKFNAYAGLKEVLRRSSLTAPSAQARAVISPSGSKGFEVFLAGAPQLNVAVTDMTGRCVKRISASASQLAVDCSNLLPGIYIVTVNGSHSQKIAIK